MPASTHSLRLLLALGLLTVLGCDKLTMPRLVPQQEEHPPAPVSVKFIFDDELRRAVLQQNVCADQLWVGPLGQVVMAAFMDIGQKRFAQATIEPPEGSPRSASDSHPDIIADVHLVKAAMVPVTRMGDSDYFHVRLDVELAVLYEDGSGKPLAEAPLRHSEQYHIWTPLLGIGGYQCATGQLKDALEKAAGDLTGQMVQHVYRLAQQQQTPGQSAAARPAPADTASVPPTPQSVAMKATLLDENENQILEAGEKVGIRVDATNSSSAPIASVSVVLSGTPVLIDAFAAILASPIQIGTLQPGETKSTVIWGRMPGKIESQRGELTVSVVVPGEGGASTAQTLVAAVRPGGARPSRNGQHDGASGQPLESDHHAAVIVALDRYRDIQPPQSAGFDTEEDVSHLLRQSAGIREERMVAMRNEHATRLDIEDALGKWLPEQVTAESVVTVYFTGRAAVDPQSGAVFLVPYDGTLSSTRRLIPLQEVHRALAALPARLSLLLIEASTIPLSTGAPPKKAKTGKTPNWQGSLSAKGKSGQAQGPVIQIVRSGEELQETGVLLKWLRGGADRNQDGIITVKEALSALSDTGKIYPALPAASPELSIPLARSTNRTPAVSSNVR